MTENRMKYDIEEVFAKYKDGQLTEVIVLWKDGDSYRATFGNPKSHFASTVNAELTNDFIQRVAAYGLYITQSQKDNYFPDIKNWSK